MPSTVSSVPPTFDAWWARAVARDPSNRFQSAKELAAALAMALGVVANREGSAGEFSGPWPSGPGSIAPHGPTEGQMTPHSIAPLPTPISSIGPQPPSSGMNSSGPTANLSAQSVSIAQMPRRSRRSIVAMASIAGVAIGGVVAVYAPAPKTEDSAAASASATAPAAPAAGPTAAESGSDVHSAKATEVAPPKESSAPPSPPAAPPSPSSASPAVTAAPHPAEARPRPQGPKPSGHKRPDFGI